MLRIGPCNIGQLVQGEAKNTETCPAPPRASKHPSSVLYPAERDTRSRPKPDHSVRYLMRYKLTVERGGHGKCQARSKSSGVRVTDEAMACGDTLALPMNKAAVPRKS